MDAIPKRENPALPWSDDLDPAKVPYLHDPHCGLKAIVVLDNLALGPATGGARTVPDVTPYSFDGQRDFWISGDRL